MKKEMKMESAPKAKTPKMSIPEKLSLLWIFALFNYLYADVLGLYDPTMLNELLTGAVGGIQFTEGFLLGAAVLMETAILMVILSRFLNYGWSRWLNIIIGAIHTLSVLGSMFVGSAPTIYYMFFGAIEVVCTVAIIWIAVKWKK